MIAQQGSFLLGNEPDEAVVAGIEAFVLEPRSAAPGSRLEKLAQPAGRGAGRPAYIDFCAILIAPGLKARMLQHLESTYNKRVQTIYPDIAGFADAVLRQQMPLPDLPRSSPGIMAEINQVQSGQMNSAMARVGLGHLY